MRTVVTPEAMRRMDAAEIARGTPGQVLMERAAKALVDELGDMLDGLSGRAVVCYCGPGNNGGDGYAAARLIARAGGKAYIRESGAPRTDDAAHFRDAAVAMGIPVLEGPPERPDAVVDALLGTGISRAPQGLMAALIDEINALGAPVISADIPSGMDAHTGRCHRPFVRAHRAVAFQLAKSGHYLTGCPEALGTWKAVDIGIPVGSVPAIAALDAEDLLPGLPPRKATAHKGTHGRVLCLCGSLGMAGAAIMSALGCLRSGAGLVTVACERDIIPILQAQVPVAQCKPIEEAASNPPRHDVLLAGCGLGQSEQTWERLMRLYSPETATVLDADALNMLARHPTPLGEKTVLTPHAGEAASLLGLSPEDVAGDMLAAAEELYAAFRCTIVLKSHTSVIRGAQGTSLNTVGSPVLAKGGSGDALAGIIAGLMAQGMPPYDAARYGCLWLGCAAQLAQQRMGAYAPLTTDILNLMGEASLPQ